LIYFDTTYIVRLYFEDLGWEKVRQLADTDQIVCSMHGRAETVAAFHRKLREGGISQSDLSLLLRQFESDSKAGSFLWLPVSTTIVDSIVSVFARLPANVALRAADAMHLSCASENRLRDIYSNDVRLLAAAAHFGLSGRDVI
jgi:predicted nucleic acid-binding protein